MAIGIPELIRREPGRELTFDYSAPTASATGLNSRLEEAMTLMSLEWERIDDHTWRVRLNWRTLVFGVISREVEEKVSVTLAAGNSGVRLSIACLPQRTHEAHAAGAAGVVLLAFTVGVLSGFPGGLLPGATTLVAGGLLTDVTRVLAMTVLEKKLKTLTVNLGENLWAKRSTR